MTRRTKKNRHNAERTSARKPARSHMPTGSPVIEWNERNLNSIKWKGER